MPHLILIAAGPNDRFLISFGERIPSVDPGSRVSEHGYLVSGKSLLVALCLHLLSSAFTRNRWNRRYGQNTPLASSSCGRVVTESPGPATARSPLGSGKRPS